MSTYLSYFSIILLIGLSVYLLIRQRSVANVTLSLISLLLASVELLDQMAIAGYHHPEKLKWYAMLCESLLPGLFLLFSLLHSRKTTLRAISMPWKLLLAGGFMLPVVIYSVPSESLFYAPDINTERMLFLGNSGQAFYLIMLCYLVVSLINLEVTFASSTGSERWRTKFTFMGMAAMIGVEVFYFSQALLYRTIDMNLIPVRAGIISVGVLLILYSKIFRGNDVSIHVSRYMLYRSLTLLLVGLYLIFMGIVGEGLRYTGINYSRALTAFIGFITGIGFLILLFSEQVRRRVKVFINKHFYPHKYDYRSQWLEFTERLSRCNGKADIEDTILNTYRETFGLSGVSLYEFDPRRRGYVYSKGISMKRTDRPLSADTGIIKYFKEKGRIFDPDTPEYSLTEEEGIFIEESGAHLIVPLIIDGNIEALILLGRQIVREELIFEDYDLMRTLARQAAFAIKNFRLSQEILDVKQMVAVARLSSFVIHDLKNMASSMGIMIDNARQYIKEPEFQDDLLKTLQLNLERMKRLISRLKYLPERSRLNIKETDLTPILREVTGEFHNEGKIRLEEWDRPVNARVDPEEIRKVFQNLIINALEAITTTEGMVTVKVYQNGNSEACVKISDNGVGMSEDFIRNHLFKPFRSTKDKGLGIGLCQCKQIIDAHGGTIDVKSAPGVGTEFTICLPFAGNHRRDKKAEIAV